MEVVHPRAQQMEPQLSEKETERAATGDSESSLEHLAGGVQLGVHSIVWEEKKARVGNVSFLRETLSFC